MFRLLPLAALLLLLPGTAAATADKVRMYEKDGSFNIDTPDNAGDVIFDGESLDGLFAIVQGLQDKVDMLMGVTSTTTTATSTTTETTTTVKVSNILDGAEVETIKGWVQSDFPAFAGKTVTLERCHSMAESTDDQATAFHATCDNKGPTVTVIKSAQGYIFGGATDASWVADTWSSETDAPFLFCLKCFGTVPDTPAAHRMHMRTATTSAFYGGTAYGPTWGGAHDLTLQGKADGSDGMSYSGLGTTYVCPLNTAESRTDECSNYFAGATDFPGSPGFFKVADFEVFVLKAE